MRRLAFVLVSSIVASLACAAGCDDALPPAGAGDYCQRDDQCIEGLVCLSRACSMPPARRGDPLPEPDTGPPPMDAGSMDGSTMDAAVDAGAMDAGTDGGEMEAGIDAGEDAGEADAGGDAGVDAG